ncbi:MAG TPA: CHAT domain-containing protein [Pyrinomonadaceae bacterium]|nr:CHAT domain-containing protein [Pyrinomonadaceae bacterium]
MTLETLFEETNELFLQRQLTRNQTFDMKIVKNLSLIFDNFPSSDYVASRKIRAFLFMLSDEYKTLFFSVLLFLLKQQQAFINGLPLLPVAEILDSIKDRTEIENYFDEILKANFTYGINLRLSSEIFINADIPEDKLLQIFSAIILSIQKGGESYFNTESKELDGIMLSLVVARKIALLIDRTDLYYATLAVMCEKLNFSENYQACRDFAEESYFTSLIDNKPEWGYFILFIAFTGQNNINYSLIYANAHLATIRKNNFISQLLAKRFLFCLIRFYRNISFHEDVLDIFHQMKNKLDLNEQDTFNITITYFTSAFSVKDASVIPDVLEYLILNREFVFNDGKNAALPLLNVIYNLNTIFKGNPYLLELDLYIPILESIVGKDDSDRIRAIVYGDSPILKNIFIESLNKLAKTRDSVDFVSETRTALILADKMIKLSFNSSNTTCFLLAMLLKADYSLVLFNENQIEYPEYVRASDSVLIDSSKVEQYENYSDFIKENIHLVDNEELLWLGESENHIYGLVFEENDFHEIFITETWNLKEMSEWLSKDFIDLAFDTTIKKHGQIEQYLEEDQIIDSERIKNILSFSRIPNKNSSRLLIVKDMEISGMPHNLILDEKGEFISRRKAIACLPSTEWFIENQKEKINLNEKFTCEMWIPTEEGDFTLNLLWSKLEDKLETFDINVTHTTLPEKPLSSEINIISAHGAKNIASFNSLFLNADKAVTKIERMIGEGKILILLVCHSGSMEKALFRQQVLSLVNNFLTNGYQAVIAPFWSLHVDIPPIWLPSFFSAIQEGKTISDAVYIANNEVYEQNKNPGAWACIHLYGNPHFGKSI